jgi:hypothetical protein
VTVYIDQVRVGLESGAVVLADLLALRRALGAAFRFHPLGFIACTLLIEGSVKLRLHCWPAIGGVQQSPDCQIHNHLFDFRSWILSGAIENIEYESSGIGEEYAVYQTEYAGDQSILTKTDQLLRLVPRSRMVFCKGQSYSVASGAFHETARVGEYPAVTVLIAKDVSSAAPLVLGPKTGSAYCTYTRSLVEEDFLEKLLSTAL